MDGTGAGGNGIGGHDLKSATEGKEVGQQRETAASEEELSLDGWTVWSVGPEGL